MWFLAWGRRCDITRKWAVTNCMAFYRNCSYVILVQLVALYALSPWWLVVYIRLRYAEGKPPGCGSGSVLQALIRIRAWKWSDSIRICSFYQSVDSGSGFLNSSDQVFSLPKYDPILAVYLPKLLFYFFNNFQHY